MNKVVLDASAVLALLLEEKGAEKVQRRMGAAVLSAVNLSEVAAKGVERGLLLEDVVRTLTHLSVEVVAFDAELAYLAASFRPATRALGLSLADRACLALGRKRQLPVLTADRAWAEVPLGVRVEVIR